MTKVKDLSLLEFKLIREKLYSNNKDSNKHISFELVSSGGIKGVGDNQVAIFPFGETQSRWVGIDWLIDNYSEYKDIKCIIPATNALKAFTRCYVRNLKVRIDNLEKFD